MRLIRKICKFRQDTIRTRGTRVIVDSRRWLTICQATTPTCDTEGCVKGSQLMVQSSRVARTDKTGQNPWTR